MSHSSSITSSTNGTITSSYLYHGRTSPILTERFPVPTPPPSSSSPVELAPILDICDSAIIGKKDFYNRPPSPDSPRLKKMTDVHSHHYHSYNNNSPPAYLEPTPQFVIEPRNSFPLELFTILKDNIKIPTLKTKLQIPIPQRKLQQQSSTNSRIIISPSPSPSSSCSTSLIEPMSPTMAAASASAAAAADHRHPGSHVAKTLLSSITDTAIVKKPQVNNNNNNVDQSMFLTKNAHIKRPRNAWIHFRCHYGQALKAQDPTLRAEEISKRASRRWGKLTENEKRPWHGLAEQEKLAHREAFPEYRYCPRRATSSSSPSSPPANNNSNNIVVNNRVRSATTSEINNTPLGMHDVFSIPTSCSNIRPQKRVKRNSK